MILLYQSAMVIFAMGLGLAAFRIRGPTGLLFTAMSLMTGVLPLIVGSGLNLVKYEEFSLLRRTSDEELALIVTTALLGTMVGYIFVLIRKLRKARRPTPIDVAKPSPRNFHGFLRLASLALLGLALLLAAIQPGGIKAVILANLNRVPKESSLSSILYAVSIVYGYCVMTLLISSVTSNKPLPKLHLLFSAVIFWSMGGRIQFASILVSYALLLLRYKRLSWLSVGLIAIPAAFAMNLILVLRLESQGAQAQSEDVGIFKLFDQLSMIGTYDLAVQYVKAHGYNPLLYPSMLIQLIPRGIFPEKPLQISRVFRSEFFFDDLGGIPPGLWGEFVITGDLVGIVVAATLFGIAIASLDMRIWTAPRHSTHLQAMYFSLIPVLGVFAVRGGIDNSIFRMAIVVGSTFGLALIYRLLVFKTIRTSPRRSQRDTIVSEGSKLAERE